MVDGRTRVCGIIANPVEHTLSPVLHNTLAKELGHNLVYVPFKPEKGGVDAAVKGAFELFVLGLNVSVPYKQEVIKSLAGLDQGAEAIGAVNTLVRTERGYLGYNTDYLGLWRALKEEGIVLEGQEVVVFGAGGAAKAAVYLCCKEGAKKVFLLNRTLEKAQKIADQYNQVFQKDCVYAMQLEEYTKIFYREHGYLAIQTSSVGMYPNVGQVILEEKEFYRCFHTAFDLIYTPAQTKFMQLAKDAGARVYNGLKMLLYQGVTAYELWMNCTVPAGVVQKCYQVIEKELHQ